MTDAELIEELKHLLSAALSTPHEDAWEVWQERACELTGSSPDTTNPNYPKWKAKQQGSEVQP